MVDAKKTLFKLNLIETDSFKQILSCLKSILAITDISHLSWLIYIAGNGLGYRLGLRFQTWWLYCTMQNFSHCMEPDSDFNPSCKLHEWDPSPSRAISQWTTPNARSRCSFSVWPGGWRLRLFRRFAAAVQWRGLHLRWTRQLRMSRLRSRKILQWRRQSPGWGDLQILVSPQYDMWPKSVSSNFSFHNAVFLFVSRGMHPLQRLHCFWDEIN